MKKITNFDFSTENIPETGEIRKFSILGDEGAVFSLEILNEDEDYYDFDNATPVLEKSFSYTVPSTDRTSTSQNSNLREYFSKYKQWIQTYSLSEECENCYNSLWTDLESLNVTW